MAKTVAMLALVSFSINSKDSTPLVGQRNKTVDVPEDMVDQLKKDKLIGDIPEKKSTKTGEVKQAGTVADKLMADAEKAKAEAETAKAEAEKAKAEAEKAKAEAEKAKAEAEKAVAEAAKK